MQIKMFNFPYFLSLFLCLGSVVGLYFLLRRRSDKCKKIVLFCILLAGLAWHFLKAFYPPYSTDRSLLLRTIWFVNICGAHIALFPIIFLSKSDHAKDYMFYMGVASGLISLLYPEEILLKPDQAAVWIDIIRFYFHHTMIMAVPLVMVLTGLHKLSYKRVWSVPFYALLIGAFIIVNQVLQSELGYIAMRGTDIVHVNYPNHSMIWGPFLNEPFSKPFTALCPKVFKTIPFGPHAGEEKYWPLIWLAVPVIVYFIPIAFLISLIFDHKNFIADMKRLFRKREKKQAAPQE